MSRLRKNPDGCKTIGASAKGVLERREVEKRIYRLERYGSRLP
jgi:hypothetical protein